MSPVRDVMQRQVVCCKWIEASGPLTDPRAWRER